MCPFLFGDDVGLEPGLSKSVLCHWVIYSSHPSPGLWHLQRGRRQDERGSPWHSPIDNLKSTITLMLGLGTSFWGQSIVFEKWQCKFWNQYLRTISFKYFNLRKVYATKRGCTHTYTHISNSRSFCRLFVYILYTYIIYILMGLSFLYKYLLSS